MRKPRYQRPQSSSSSAMSILVLMGPINMSKMFPLMGFVSTQSLSLNVSYGRFAKSIVVFLSPVVLLAIAVKIRQVSFAV